MQHCAPEMFNRVHLECEGGVLARPGFTGTRTSAPARLPVSGGAAVPLKQTRRGIMQR